MTVKATLAAIRDMGMVASHDADSGEYRVAYLTVDIAERNYGSTRKQIARIQEDTAYYTTGADDAIATARAMSERNV